MELNYDDDGMIDEMETVLNREIHRRLICDYDESSGFVDFCERVRPYFGPLIAPLNAILAKYGYEVPATFEAHCKKVVISLALTQGRLAGTKAVRVNTRPFTGVYGLN